MYRRAEGNALMSIRQPNRRTDSVSPPPEAWHTLRYHLVWATRRRRRVLVGRIKARTEELVRQAAEGQGCAVEVLEVSPDCVHVVLTAPPDRSPQQIVAGLKRESYAELKEEAVARGPSLWTRRFLASTEPVEEERQRAFVEAQSAG